MQFSYKWLQEYFEDPNPEDGQGSLPEIKDLVETLTFHVFGHKRRRLEEKKKDIEDEMGDIIYTLVCFANSQGIDLDKVIQKTIDKDTTRDKDRYKK